MTLAEEKIIRVRRRKMLDDMLEQRVKAYIRTTGGSGFWIHGVLHRIDGYGYSIETCTGFYKIDDPDDVERIEHDD